MIKDLFSDASLHNQSITVNGWVRSRRDSKAGISFLALHDGSCFATIQAVVPNTLPNYEQEILKLTKGLSVINLNVFSILWVD